MSCVLPKEGSGSHPYPVNASEAQTAFCEEMANGLHAMAQPLTIVRGALAALMGAGENGLDNRRYLEMSASQVERMCDLLAQMQRLVDAHQFEADLETLDLGTLIHPAVEDMDAVFRRLGIKLTVAIPEKGIAVVADRERTTQAVRSILNASASISSPGDAVRLLVLPQDGGVEMIVENCNSHGRAFNSSQRLSLSLAEANMRTQQGSFRYSENPIRITLAFTTPNVKRDITRDEDQTEEWNSLRPDAIVPLPQCSY